MLKYNRIISIIIFITMVMGVMLTGCSNNTHINTTEKNISEPIILKLAHVLPTDHLNHSVALKFADLVNEKTKGQVIIEVYPASQLGNEKEIIDAVAMGTLDFALCGFGEVAKRYDPALIFDGPFIFKNREHLAKVFKSEVFEEMMNGMKEEAGIAMISPGYYGTRYVTTTDTIVTRPEDLNGLKLRCPDQPMFVAVTEAMGATPTPMAFSEVYLALQQGIVDGQENPPAAITSMKFFEVQNYLAMTGHIIQANNIFGSSKVLNKLPDDIQKAIEEAGKEVSEFQIEEAFAIEDQLLKDLESNGMIIIEPDHNAFVEAVTPIYEEYEEKWGKGLLEKIRSVK
jgi:C4-dicarboxylate-binding protein DctP